MKTTETARQNQDRSTERFFWVILSVATALLAGVVYGLYVLGGYMTAMTFVAGLVAFYVVIIVTRMRRNRAKELEKDLERWRNYR